MSAPTLSFAPCFAPFADPGTNQITSRQSHIPDQSHASQSHCAVQYPRGIIGSRARPRTPGSNTSAGQLAEYPLNSRVLVPLTNWLTASAAVVGPSVSSTMVRLSAGLCSAASINAATLSRRAVTRIEPRDHYDLVIVAVKAPALDEVLRTAAPAIGPGTMILPVLNGMDHLDALQAAYPGQGLGGLVKIVATLDEAGAILQRTPLSTMTILDGRPLRDDIREALTGDIVAAGGEDQILQAIAEAEETARAAGHTVTAGSHARISLLTERGSSFTSSLYRDLQHGEPAESEHILGGLAARARTLHVATPLLDAALLQMRTHQRARMRTMEAPR